MASAAVAAPAHQRSQCLLLPATPVRRTATGPIEPMITVSAPCLAMATPSSRTGGSSSAQPWSPTLGKVPTPVRGSGMTPKAVRSATPLVSPRQFLEATPSSCASHCPPASVVAAVGCVGAIDVEDIAVGVGPCDPLRHGARQQVLRALGVAEPVAVEAKCGVAGGLNGGIWFVKGSGADLVLKLVPGSRSIAMQPTESEALQSLAREHPDIANDLSMAFPFKILRLHCDTGYARQDLLAMDRAPGRALAEIMADWVRRGRASELPAVFQKVGESLGMLHCRYGNKQHGDLQASNIFFDEATFRVTFIDVAGMASKTVDGDLTHFENSLKMLGAFYDSNLIDSWCEAFRRGHALGRSCPNPPAPSASPNRRRRDIRQDLVVPMELDGGVQSPQAAKDPLMKCRTKAQITLRGDGREERDEPSMPWFDKFRKRLFGSRSFDEENDEDEEDDVVSSRATVSM
mmetsp:Transcript_118841/g.341206  ORF Transcript_118841/g.341206 Transcript_118841/m.341206 type:complete len:460 (-) Transcript_118841:160-1539(-)